MKSLVSPKFASFITSFLTDYLPLQRGLSKNTILSYRDTIKLFMKFLQQYQAMRRRKTFSVKDLNREIVVEFLNWYRASGASNSASNQRLACLKTFVSFLELENLDCIARLQAVTQIKSKKAVPREIQFLTPEQISLFINLPKTNSPFGFKHRVILTLLYDTGCRVEELCKVRLCDIALNDPGTIKLHGKGKKTRAVVVSSNTINLLKIFINKFRPKALNTDYLITNKFKAAIDRDGITYVVKKYAALARDIDHSFPENVHCHMLRHSKAMHMLEAGINIIYIRDFLGHENLSTTMVYAKTNNRVKDEVINKLAPSLVDEEEERTDWSKDTELLNFLANFN
jgi:integrase/recombinase XerD